jgi:hypothetical protein
MRQILLKKENKALCIKDQASCDEEAMEGHVHKRKKNLMMQMLKHVETSLSFLPLDEGEVVQPCSPPAHEVEEAIVSMMKNLKIQLKPP